MYICHQKIYEKYLDPLFDDDNVLILVPLIYDCLISVKNSSLVFGLSRNSPNIVDVTVLLLIFCTPRITIHIWLKKAEFLIKLIQLLCNLKCWYQIYDTYTPSMITATPAGCTAWVTATAICFVRRSWTCKRREKISTILLEKIK